MSRRRAGLGRGAMLAIASGAFLAGVLVATALLPGAPPDAERITAAADTTASDAAEMRASESIEVRPSAPESPPPVAAPVPEPDALPAISADPVEDRRRRQLTLPVQGMTREELQDTFNDMRGGTRRHEALDVLAPRHTPVLAVEDGRVARLFLSKAGGTTVYQFDPTGTYVYYYAHLERYAPGLEEGDAVTRGQVLGYVGTSGNAPPDTPHLHFAIFKMTDEKKWWQGTPIDPYSVLR